MQNELFGNYPVLYQNKEVGMLHITREGLRALFHATCHIETSEILKLSIQSEEKHISLGVMAPKDNTLSFTKHFTKHDLHIRGISSIDTALLLTLKDAATPLSTSSPPQAINPAPQAKPAPKMPVVQKELSPTVPAAVLTGAAKTEQKQIKAPPLPPVLPPTLPIQTETVFPKIPPQKNAWDMSAETPSVMEELLHPPKTFVPPVIAPPTQVEANTPVPPNSDWEFVDTWGKVEKDGQTHFTLHPPAQNTLSPIVDDALVMDVNPYPEMPKISSDKEHVSAWSNVSAQKTQQADTWSAVASVSDLFADPLLKSASSGITGAFIKEDGKHTYLAIPFESGAPFPLMPVFCKGTPEQINGKTYLLFQIAQGQIV